MTYNSLNDLLVEFNSEFPYQLAYKFDLIISETGIYEVLTAAESVKDLSDCSTLDQIISITLSMLKKGSTEEVAYDTLKFPFTEQQLDAALERMVEVNRVGKVRTKLFNTDNKESSFSSSDKEERIISV